jgi:hypothetical protein
MGVNDAGRDEVELEDPITDSDGVTGIVATAVTGDDVGIGGEQVDHAAFAFVPPLRPEDDI